MPPCPSSSRISNWGNSLATSATAGGTNAGTRLGCPGSGATAGPNPAFMRHSGHKPLGALAGSGFWHDGQICSVSITLFQPSVTQQEGRGYTKRSYKSYEVAQLHGRQTPRKIGSASCSARG